MPRSWKWLSLLAVVLLAFTAFAACGDDDEEDTGDGSPTATADEIPAGKVVVAEGGQKIQVGVTAVLAGDLEALGATVLAGVELAAQQKGAIEGFEVEIVSADDQCDAAGAIPAAQQLLAFENLVAVIG